MQTDKYQKLITFHFAKEIAKRHTRKQLRCVIFGNFGANNLGDEALLAGEIQELQTLNNIKITVAARNPAEIKRLHNVQAIKLTDFNAIRKELKRSDFAIVGGGGLINKVQRGVIGFVYQLMMLAFFFYLPLLLKKKLYVLGVGVYNNANPLIVSLVVPALRAAEIVTVRDFTSQAFLKEKDVLSSLYKDNSYLMPTLTKQQVLKEAFFAEKYNPDKINIGISLVKPVNKKDEKRLITAMEHFVSLYQGKADFWFFPADFHPGYDHDAKFAEAIKGLQPGQSDSNVYFVPTTYSPELFFSSFRLMDKMVAMRFHAMLFAYRLKVPFVGIPYETKCTSLIESIGRKPLSLKTLKNDAVDKNVL